MRRRVVVTGVGAVSSIGTTAEDFWKACLAGESRVERVPDSWRRHNTLSSTLWSPLPDLDLSSLPFSRLERAQQDGVAILALVAAFQALKGAGLPWEVANRKRNTLRLLGPDPERILVAVGTGIGGVSSLLSNYRFHTLGPVKKRLQAWAAEAPENGSLSASDLEDLESGLAAPPRMSPLVVPMAMPNTAAGALSIKLSTHGPANTHCSACAAGTVAIGQAFQAIRAGVADLALAGGAERMSDSHGGLFRAFDIARTLVQDDQVPEAANRPFDQRRSGFLFSEGGSGILVLEEMDHARRRGAPMLAEVAGFAETSDAHNIVAPAPGGRQIERAVRDALADARISPESIGYVNAHGTGTVANDVVEAEVIRRIFGTSVAVSSTKSLLGHTLGASGALEAVATILSLRDQTLHACRNLDEPVSDLNFVRRPEKLAFDAAVSQSFAFGGHNAALVLRRSRSSSLTSQL